MRWYEYKMEVDDLHASDDLKARLLAMQAAAADTPGAKSTPKLTPAPESGKKQKKAIRFPVRRLMQLAACAALCIVGYGALSSSSLNLMMGAKSSAPMEYSAASVESSYALMSQKNTADAAGGAALTSGDLKQAENSRRADDARIIYTANLTLETRDYDASRSALDRALSDVGGYLESSTEDTCYDSSRSLSLTLRVPQDQYQSFLDAAAQAGSVTSRSQEAEDVTSNYLDLEARLANLTAQRTRLQELQAKADTLADLLEIESSLSDVQYQIESWQRQLDWYTRQVECCTVYITLNEVETLTPTSTTFGSRFLTALRDGWSGFVAGSQDVVLFLVSCWPVIVIASIGGVIFYRVRHLKKKK